MYCSHTTALPLLEDMNYTAAYIPAVLLQPALLEGTSMLPTQDALIVLWVPGALVVSTIRHSPILLTT